MNVVFNSVPPHPIVQSEAAIEPIIPPLISEMSDIFYTHASNQDELLAAFNSLATNITKSSGLVRYSILIYSVSYVDQNMFPSFMESNLPGSICSILNIETDKFRKKEIDNQFFLMIQRCVLPFSQMIINDDQNALLLEKSIIKASLKKSIHLLRSIHISIRLTQWTLNIDRDAQTLQLILSALRKIKMSAIPNILATEIAHSLVITVFLFQTISFSSLYQIRKDIVICFAKLLIDQPNSFANPSTIECLNYLNEHDINYKNMNINTSSSKPFLIDHKSKRFITAIPVIDALRIPDKVPINSILQQIRFTLFSVNIYDLSNLLNISTISLSSQSSIICCHPELVNLEGYNKTFFGRCLSIDTVSKFIKFDKTPKNIVELASFLRSRHITKSAHLNALTKDLDKIINVVYMSIKRLPRISTDFQTQISSAKIMSFFISHITHKKLIKYGILKHNVSLTPQSKLYPYSVTSLSISEDVKSMTKKIKKIFEKDFFTSLLPRSFIFISEIIADSQIASPFFPHSVISDVTFSSSCCPESLLLLSSFEELSKSLALHPKDFLSVTLSTNPTTGRVKLLTVAIKSVISSHNDKGEIKINNNNDDDGIDDDDLDQINDSLIVDEETVEVWKRMMKSNLNKVCQFGLSILKVPTEITCKIAADFYLTLVAFISIFLEKEKEKEKKNVTVSSSTDQSDSSFSFIYDDLYAVLFMPMNMLISITNTLFQIEPLNNPKSVINFLGFIERIVSSETAPDLAFKAKVVKEKVEGDDQKSSDFKLTTKVNVTAIVKSFFILNGPLTFWNCLYNLMSVSIASVSGLLPARAIKIIASISDFNNTLQIRLSIAQRLVIDVLHNSIITNIIDMLSKMTIEIFEHLPVHEKCLLSLAMSDLLLSWCEPIPLAAFVSSRISPDIFNLIEKLSFSISESINGSTTINSSQVLTKKQKHSLAFENSVLDILSKVKDKFDFAMTNDCDDDLVIAQQSIQTQNIPQKLSGLFFMALQSVINYDE